MLFFPLNIKLNGNLGINKDNNFCIKFLGIKLLNVKFKFVYKQLILINKYGKKTIIKLKGIYDIKNKIKILKNILLTKIYFDIDFGDMYGDFILPIMAVVYTISYPVGGFIYKNCSNLNYGINFIATDNNELNLSFRLSVFINIIAILKYILVSKKEKLNEKRKR